MISLKFIRLSGGEGSLTFLQNEFATSARLRRLRFILTKESRHKSILSVSLAVGGLSVKAEVKGFEPLYPVKDHAFQACAIDHYATPPSIRSDRIIDSRL
jgi:hypothetical protein